MPHGATFDSFQCELARLVDIFGKNLAAYKSAAYDEASLRQEFLNPLFRALGWDIENKAGLILQRREVVRVMLEQGKVPPVVVTVYRSSKIEKYWRQT
jgi:hypothetical protein